jgi:rRNA-processing protein FCF1
LKVVFDSSFLIAVLERPTTWYEDISGITGNFVPVLLDSVRTELERIAAKQTKRGRLAALALEMSDSFAREGETSGRTDSEIISYAITEKAAVATVDGEMIRRLRGMHTRAFTLRSGRVALA